MANVSVSGPIINFQDTGGEADEAPPPPCPQQLRLREMAERAAAKATATLAGRRAHQELAQLIHAQRLAIEQQKGAGANE